MFVLPDVHSFDSDWKWLRNHILENSYPDIFEIIKSSLFLSNREMYLYTTTIEHWRSLFPKNHYREWLHARIEHTLKSVNYQNGIYNLYEIDPASPMHNLEKLLSIAESLSALREFYNPFSLRHIGNHVVSIHPGTVRSMLFDDLNPNTKIKLSVTDFSINKSFLDKLNKNLKPLEFSKTSNNNLLEFYQLNLSNKIKLRVDTRYGYQIVDMYIPQVSNKRNIIEISKDLIKVESVPLIVRGEINRLSDEVIKLIR